MSIGPYPCNVINHLTSDTLITCETTPGNFGTYVVTVVVDGAYSASSCCFTYDRTLTPSERQGRHQLGTGMDGTDGRCTIDSVIPWFCCNLPCHSPAGCMQELTSARVSHPSAYAAAQQTNHKKQVRSSTPLVVHYTTREFRLQRSRRFIPPPGPLLPTSRSMVGTLVRGTHWTRAALPPNPLQTAWAR